MTQRKSQKPTDCKTCGKSGDIRAICPKCMRMIGCGPCFIAHTKECK